MPSTQEDFRGPRQHPGSRASARRLPSPSCAAALLGERRLSSAWRCAAAFFFGIAFLYPDITSAALIRLFIGYALVDGILALAPGGWSLAEWRVWPLLAGGCVAVAAAGAAYTWPGINLPTLVDIAMVWAAGLGIASACAGAALHDGDRDDLMLLGGIASLVLARALLSHLASDLVVLSTWLGLYALTMGILFLKLTLRHYWVLLLE